MFNISIIENEMWYWKTIAVYSVFPGMELVYNDMHMKYCNKNAKVLGRIFLKLIIAERGGLNVLLENIVIVT